MTIKKARLDVVSASLSYAGRAAMGVATSTAGWQIKEITVSGTQTIVKYADGDTLYDNVWDNRAALTYSE